MKRKCDEEVPQDMLLEYCNEYTSKSQSLEGYATTMRNITHWSLVSDMRRETALLAGRKWVEGRWWKVFIVGNS